MKKLNLRMCEVVLYQEQYPTIEDVKSIITTYDTIKKWAVVLHDKDEKKAHYHVALYFGVPFDVMVLTAWFQIKPQAINRIKGRWTDVLQYLTHSNAPDKHQYAPEDVHSNFDVTDAISEAKNASQAKQMVLAYASLEVSYSQLVKTLTPAERMKYNRDIDVASKVRNDTVKMKGNRDMKVYYITGQSGSGKTTFAKFICEKVLKADYYVAGSSNDALQDYMGQKAIIFDDLRGDSFKYHDLLKALDPHTQSSVKSRYFNKAIDCEYIFITSIKPVTNLYENQTNEDLFQLVRRVDEFVDIKEDTIRTYKVDYEKFRSQGRLVKKDVQTLPITPKEIVDVFRAIEVATPPLRKMMDAYFTQEKAKKEGMFK
jgi:RecA/RadA recombinase